MSRLDHRLGRFEVITGAMGRRRWSADYRAQFLEETLVPGAVDFRKGAEGLAASVRENMGADPFSGAVCVFRARRAERIKLVYFDGTGVCLFSKRLEDGKFQWPAITDGVVRLTAAQLQALLEGLDWRRVHERRETQAPIAAS